MALLLFLSLPLHAESDSPAPPKVPEEPSVRPVKEEEKTGGEAPVLLVTARGKKTRGRLRIKAPDLDIPVLHGDAVKPLKVAIASIDSIEFLRWEGRERRKNEFEYRPVMVRFTLRDGKVVLSAGHIPSLDRLSFRDGGRERTVFSCFRDYRKNGRWVHSGAAAIDHPEKNPHGDTLVRIEFETPPAFNPLEMLFKGK
jgi:hypothetical protein